MLEKHPDARLQVFAVWEPMLAADWRAPATGTLARLPDRRVSQFWDKGHVLAKRLAADARDPQPKPTCCMRRGVFWDLAAMYPAGAVWGEKLPPATLFDGPVVRAAPRIEAQLTHIGRRRSPTPRPTGS